MEYHFKGEIRTMNKEKMQDIKERLDLFPSNMNEPAQKAYCELFDYINHLEQQCQKQQEAIDKAMNWTIKYQTEWCQEDEVIRDLKQLLDILKGEEE